ncbi:hypothetical protein PanWU01x14_159670 [Parasponia andersonii]|uniref:Uncharacterized protein n=1 Tax=Parasponia andersonii TaxID=3476 RepID=A0A2P5CEL4_PARAD|nr:hypothetical protein PanWU01x14_159670 [Parasponia andersonii]
MSRNKISILVKVDVEKFDGNINFDLWQIQVNDLLIQFGLHKKKGRETYKDKDSKKSSINDKN